MVSALVAVDHPASASVRTLGEVRRSPVPFPMALRELVGLVARLRPEQPGQVLICDGEAMAARNSARLAIPSVPFAREIRLGTGSREPFLGALGTSGVLRRPAARKNYARVRSPPPRTGAARAPTAVYTKSMLLIDSPQSAVPVDERLRRANGSRARRAVSPSAGVDLEAAEEAVGALLEALGADVTDEHLRDTPRRVAEAYAELLTPRPFDITTFANDEGYGELVVARDIPFHSLCRHHLLPFVGVAHVGYLPGERILGLSKLARVVEAFARGLQTQERLTKQVADWLERHLHPKGVGVVIEAEHLCMTLRGANARGTKTMTSALNGLLREDARTRQEFLALARAGAI